MEDFLSKNKGAHEPGLIIALDHAHLLKVEEYLMLHNFNIHTDPQTLSQEFRVGGNLYTPSREIDSISFFDVVTGFSSGLIDFKQLNVSPKYSNTNYILVFTQDFIKKEEQEGRSWLSLCGLTMQAE